jgi:hypothetical protein
MTLARANGPAGQADLQASEERQTGMPNICKATVNLV